MYDPMKNSEVDEHPFLVFHHHCTTDTTSLVSPKLKLKPCIQIFKGFCNYRGVILIMKKKSSFDKFLLINKI